MAKGKHCFLLSFSNKEEMEKVKEGCNLELGQKGIFIKSMEKDINEPRVVWIEIRGIPVRAWSVETFSNIADFWGDFLTTDESTKVMRDIGGAKIMIGPSMSI